MAKFIKVEKSNVFHAGKYTYDIANKRSGSILGLIFWYPPWEQWVVQFEENSVWSEDCLEDVRKFIREITEKEV